MKARRGVSLDITALHKEVTGSCLYVTVREGDNRQVNFLVDCGLFQESQYDYLNAEPFPFNSENVDFCVVTHNHTDHIGKLPQLVKSGFTGKIYAPESTAELLPLAIQNTFEIMKEDYKKQGKKLLYTEDDVEAVYNQLVPCKYEKTFYVDSNISITIFDNAHLIGAGMIYVRICEQGEKEINLLFTGDYKKKNVFKQVARLPKWIRKKPMIIVSEATYGTTDSYEVEKHFEEDVERLTKEHKNMLISATAQGRAQELLYALKRLQDREKLNTEIPIGLDGKLAHQYTRMYRSGRLEVSKDKIDFLPRNFFWLNKDNREEFYANNKQKIIVCTSGMLDHGPAQLYLPRVLERTDWAVYVTCYCPETTFGYRLQNAKNGKVKIQGKEVQVRAQVLSTAEYSAHAKADEIEQFIKEFENPWLVLLNHGDTGVTKQFAMRLELKDVARRVEILGSHTVRITNGTEAKVLGSKLNNEARTKIKKNKATNMKKVKGKKENLKKRFRGAFRRK